MAVKRYLLLLFLVKVSAGGYDLGLDRGQMSAMLIFWGDKCPGANVVHSLSSAISPT